MTWYLVAMAFFFPTYALVFLFVWWLMASTVRRPAPALVPLAFLGGFLLTPAYTVLMGLTPGQLPHAVTWLQAAILSTLALLTVRRRPKPAAPAPVEGGSTDP